MLFIACSPESLCVHQLNTGKYKYIIVPLLPRALFALSLGGYDPIGLDVIDDIVALQLLKETSRDTGREALHYAVVMVADFTTTLLDVLGVFLDLFFIRTIFENDDVSLSRCHGGWKGVS